MHRCLQFSAVFSNSFSPRTCTLFMNCIFSSLSKRFSLAENLSWEMSQSDDFYRQPSSMSLVSTHSFSFDRWQKKPFLGRNRNHVLSFKCWVFVAWILPSWWTSRLLWRGTTGQTANSERLLSILWICQLKQFSYQFLCHFSLKSR